MRDIFKFVDNPFLLIADGVANIGGFDTFLKKYRASVVHVFEEIPSFVRLLEKKYEASATVTVHCRDRRSLYKQVPFNIFNNANLSSELHSGTWNHKYNGAKIIISRTIRVEQWQLNKIVNG